MLELLDQLPPWAQLAVSIGLTLGATLGALLFLIGIGWRYLKSHEVSVLNGKHAEGIQGIGASVDVLVSRFDTAEGASKLRHADAQASRRQLFDLVRANENAIVTERERVTAVMARTTRIEEREDR